MRRAAGSGRPVRSLNCYDSYQLMNSSVSPGKTPFLYFESKYPALTRWPIFALRIDDGDTWHTPVYSTTMVSPPYFWLSSRWIVVVSASSSMSVISPVLNVMYDIGPPLAKPSSIGICSNPVSLLVDVHPFIVAATTAAVTASLPNLCNKEGPCKVGVSVKVEVYVPNTAVPSVKHLKNPETAVVVVAEGLQEPLDRHRVPRSNAVFVV